MFLLPNQPPPVPYPRMLWHQLNGGLNPYKYLSLFTKQSLSLSCLRGVGCQMMRSPPLVILAGDLFHSHPQSLKIYNSLTNSPDLSTFSSHASKIYLLVSQSLPDRSLDIKWMTVTTNLFRDSDMMDFSLFDWGFGFLMSTCGSFMFERNYGQSFNKCASARWTNNSLPSRGHRV